MKSAVTGGSGVVGSSLIELLVEDGHEVKAMARSEAAGAKVASMGAIPVPGDVLDPSSLQDLVEHCETVFHVAGVNELCSRDPKRMWKVNVEGTRLVVNAARLCGSRRVIHTSSAVTVRREDEMSGLPETFVSDYQESKVRAEIVAFEEARGVEVVAVNPTSVQGPGRSTGTGALVLAAARRRLRMVANTTFSLVDTRDCARGHLLAAQHGEPGERYLLSGATLTMPEAIALLNEVTGASSSPRVLSAAQMRFLGRLGDVWGAVSRTRPALCSETVRVMTQDHVYDGSRAVDDLGLTYTPVEQTLRETVEWFRKEGLLAED